ncbi:hypothetical protein [Leptospira interrogans]|uniref:Uncharacterized protein n=1 Tax=Leptospira interrogans serovar Bataviae TaxID=312175 RepID=A0AAQ0B4R0_LEPIR|nr:hypothetical protein [Leptospira interrogans]MBM2889076.1 hypothetical protein [Leptospira interrogans]QOI52447.1 hypothetical protein Lepto1489_01550 [Leptospira interrogans serovar Bataviae]UMQ60238.1 hypothetical protein FH585_03285 [Leptospira interrogans]UNE69021.1 hypothetical protein FH588_18820 [Leptospira interrogans]
MKVSRFYDRSAGHQTLLYGSVLGFGTILNFKIQILASKSLWACLETQRLWRFNNGRNAGKFENPDVMVSCELQHSIRNF